MSARRPKEAPKQQPQPAKPGFGGVAAFNDSPLVQALKAQAIGHHVAEPDEQLKHILETLRKHPEHRAFVVNLVSNALMSLGLKELKPKTRFLGLNLMELLNYGMKGKEAITSIYTALEARAKSGEESDYQSAESDAEADYETADEGLEKAMEKVDAMIAARLAQ